MGGMLLTIFVLSNIGIAAGYIYAATAVMPKMHAKRLQTKVGGVLFFATCGLTHLEMALHASSGHVPSLGYMTSWHMVLIHLVQVFAVWAFLTGLYAELVEGTISVPFAFEEKGGGSDDSTDA